MADEQTDDRIDRSFAELPDDEYSSYVGLVGHFYRAETERMTAWRARLDQTTNWAVVVFAAILTWAFTSPDNPHYVLLVGMLATLVFLFVEAQRYQEYDVWRARVRVVQEHVFAEAYDPADRDDVSWRQWLGEDLRTPTPELSLPRAAGHRLQHVYLPLLTVLLVAWLLRVTVFDADATWSETASIAGVPGVAVVAGVIVCYLSLLVLVMWSVRRGVRRELDYRSDPNASPDDR